ncbi:MAG: oligosaccharide flippase family protein [Deltaproteobacteria bacterium]|nr:oligosaccharide flippase family protein [Deltaproteobacteria bacterium]
MSGARVGLNSLILIGSEAVRRGMAFVIYALIARALGVEEFGVFRLAGSFLVIFLVLAQFGITPMLTRRVATGREDERKLLGEIQGLKIVLGFAVFVLTAIAAALFGYRSHTFYAIVMMALAIPAEALSGTHGAFYDGKQRMEVGAIADFGRSVVLLAGVAVALWKGWGLYGIIGAYLTHYVVGWLMFETVTARFFVRAVPRFAVTAWKAYLREALPYLVIGMVWTVAFRVDMIMLSKLRDEVSVGYYGSAYTLFELLLVLPTMCTRALFPALSRAKVAGTDADMLQKAMRLFFLIGVPAGVGMAILSVPAIELVFGSEYTRSAPTLALLSSCLLLWFLTMGLSWAMTARERLNVVLRANISALIANIAANFVLIPTYDYFGAALATVISESIYICVLIVPVHREIMPITPRLAHPGVFLSALIMGGAVWWGRAWPLYAVIPLGIVVYAAGAWITGAAREPFIVATARSIIKRKTA